MNRRRQNLLDYIVWYRDNFKTTPTIKEIVTNFGYSDGTARHHLGILVRLGKISWDTKVSRGIHLVVDSAEN